MKYTVLNTAERKALPETYGIPVYDAYTLHQERNLPKTHRDGITNGTDAEVRNYLKAHGTPRQKELYGIR